MKIFLKRLTICSILASMLYISSAFSSTETYNVTMYNGTPVEAQGTVQQYDDYQPVPNNIGQKEGSTDGQGLLELKAYYSSDSCNSTTSNATVRYTFADYPTKGNNEYCDFHTEYYYVPGLCSGSTRHHINPITPTSQPSGAIACTCKSTDDPAGPCSMEPVPVSSSDKQQQQKK